MRITFLKQISRSRDRCQSNIYLAVVVVVVVISGVVVGAVVEEGRLLHPVLLGHLVVVEEAAGAPAHPLGLVLDPLAHAA